MPRPWPIGSTSRIVADLDSGTKIAVSRIASAQIGRLIQNTARQSTSSISAPPTIGPSAIEMPTTPPQTPIARARSTRPVNTWVMIDIATGFIIEPPMACRNRARDQRLDVGREAAQQRAEREDRQPDLEHAPAAEPVAGGAGQHQQRRQHQRVDVDDPLQLRRRRAEIGADVGNGDVDDRRVHRHDQQAQAAGHQDDGLAPSAQRPDDSFIHTTIVKLQLSGRQAIAT